MIWRTGIGGVSKNPLSVARPRASILSALNNKLLCPRDRLPVDWRRTTHPDYEDIQCTYSLPPRLVCNGIEIRASRNDVRQPVGTAYTHVPMSLLLTHGQSPALDLPLISVFDPDARLPLNLARTSCNLDRASFTDALLQDICRDLIAYMLVYTPTAPVSWPQTHAAYDAFQYPGLAYKSNTGHVWFWCTEHGVSVSDLWFFHQLQPQRLFIAPYEAQANRQNFGHSAPMHLSPPENTYPILGYKQENENRNDWFAFAGNPFKSNDTGHFSGIKPTGMRMLVPIDRIEVVQEVAHPGIEPWLSEMQRKDLPNGWTMIEIGNCHSAILDYEQIASREVAGAYEIGPFGMPTSNGFAEWNFVEPIGWYTDDRFRSILSMIWEDLMPVPYIPYNIGTRREVCKRAYNELAEQIKLWEATFSSSASGVEEVP